MNSRFSIFLRYIASLAAAMLAIPVTATLLSHTFPQAIWAVPLVTVLSVLGGTFLQSLYAAFIGKHSSRDGLSHDGQTVNRFHYRYAILPVLGDVLFSVAVKYGMDRYYRYLYEHGQISYYDSDGSVLPYLAAVSFFLCFFAGIVIWFYPAERFHSAYTMIWAMGILLVEFGIYTFYGGRIIADRVVFLFPLCLIVFFVCITILYNQGFLEKSYRGSVVSVFQTEDRLYNIFLVGILFLVLLVMVLFVYAVVSALYSIGSSFLFIILYKILYADASDDPARQFAYQQAAAQKGEMMQKAHTQTDIAVLFTLGILLVLLFIGCKTGYLQKRLIHFVNWIHEIFSVILQRGKYRKEEEQSAYQNYRDEKIRIQNAYIRDYEQMAAEVDSYKHFQQRLSRLPDAGAQVCFAYAVLVQMYRRGYVNLKSSDTPREVEYKVLRAVTGEEIRPITAAFEKIKYGEQDLPLEEAETILQSMCEIIHRYLA